MTSRKMTPGYFMNNGHTNPTTTIRKSFTTGQQWNPSGWSDPAYDKKMDEVYAERDEGKRQAMLKEMTREILDKAPYIWLPTPLHLHGLVAVGEELQRRIARRRRASRPDLRPHLGRPGAEEEDGLLTARPSDGGEVHRRRVRPMPSPLLQVRNLTTRFNTERGRVDGRRSGLLRHRRRRDRGHRRRVGLGQERHRAVDHAPDPHRRPAASRPAR